jgi:hypothetical protein
LLSAPDGLAQALRELGRIERTLFTLDWIQNPDLRQRATIGLNKGEARNTLARAVFFHRRGAVRDRLREDLQNKASGLNLAVAAIILWKTVYLQKAVQMLADEGTPVPPECMPHLSPLGWEHINMTGDYVWSLQRVTTLEKLRPLRRDRLRSRETLTYSQKAAGGLSRPKRTLFSFWCRFANMSERSVCICSVCI